MKIKLTFNELLNLYASQLFKQLNFEKISNPYSAYKIQRILKSIQNYGVDIAKQYNQLIKKYAKPFFDKDGKETEKIFVDPGDKEKFAQFTQEEKVYLEKREEFNFEYILDLKDLDGIKISAQDISILTPILNKEKIDDDLKKQK